MSKKTQKLLPGRYRHFVNDESSQRSLILPDKVVLKLKRMAEDNGYATWNALASDMLADAAGFPKKDRNTL
jgi:hypothetical protein